MTEGMRKVLFSSEKSDWGTPQWLFDKLYNQYSFNLDLCADSENRLLPQWCEDVQSGLVYLHGVSLSPREYVLEEKKLIWEGTVFFCNPPYGRTWPKILHEIPTWAHGVFLLPSRTGSQWFQYLLNRASWVLFLKGRLTFKGAASSAPFDSVLFGYNVFPPRGIDGKLIELR